MSQPKSIIKIIDGLLPQSKEWLVQRGYVTREGEELQVTPAGYNYFIRTTRGYTKADEYGEETVAHQDQEAPRGN